MRDPGPVRDPGAAPERTRLAWRRTGMSAAAVGLLEIRPAFEPGAGATQWLIAALAMAGWAAMIGLSFARGHALRDAAPKPAGVAVEAYALITAGLAVIAGLVVML
ncbi:DUF202 domain-containing protein [Actinoplanes sp. NPDC051851]|uniref:DUF202 domain-containing protein n=1 Tax=Actinoplanes sp. NPDC051851 TaxID=3154753 RepID=UPI0034323EFA